MDTKRVLPHGNKAARAVPPGPRISARMLACATEALTQLLAFSQPADGTLSAYFRAHPELGSRERAFIAETCYLVLRRKRQIEKRIAPLREPRLLVLSALLGFEGQSQRQLIDAVGKEDREWMAEFKARPQPELSVAEQADLPDWLAERLLARYSPEELMPLCRALNQAAPLDLRVNSLKAGRDDVLAQLNEAGIAAEACRLAPLGVRLKSKPALARHPLYLNGSIEVQDEGSQLLGHLLAPKRGEMVADFCAGAGGKTLLLGALMRSTGRLYAFDVSAKRLARLKPRVARAGLSNVHPIRISGENDVRIKRLADKLDRVLVDAPCSGLGTLRRNPDLKWRQTPEGIEELMRKQGDILAAAARLVKPGGRLVYATCSILKEENEDIVAAFLARHPEFHRRDAAALLAQQGIVLSAPAPAPAGGAAAMDMTLLPHRDDTDGFYAAVLERDAAGRRPGGEERHQPDGG